MFILYYYFSKYAIVYSKKIIFDYLRQKTRGFARRYLYQIIKNKQKQIKPLTFGGRCEIILENENWILTFIMLIEVRYLRVNRARKGGQPAADKRKYRRNVRGSVPNRMLGRNRICCGLSHLWSAILICILVWIKRPCTLIGWRARSFRFIRLRTVQIGTHSVTITPLHSSTQAEWNIWLYPEANMMGYLL